MQNHIYTVTVKETSHWDILMANTMVYKSYEGIKFRKNGKQAYTAHGELS